MRPYGRPGQQAAEPHVDNLQRAHQIDPQHLNFFVYIPQEINPYHKNGFQHIIVTQQQTRSRPDFNHSSKEGDPRAIHETKPRQGHSLRVGAHRDDDTRGARLSQLFQNQLWHQDNS